MKLDPNSKVESFVATEGPGPDAHGTVVPSDSPVEMDGLTPAQKKMLEDSLKPGWFTTPRARLLLLETTNEVGYGIEFYQIEMNKMRCGSIDGQAAHARFLMEKMVFEMRAKKGSGVSTLDDQQKHEKVLERHRLWWQKWAARVPSESRGKTVEQVFEDSLKDFSGNSYEVTRAALAELGLVQLLDLNGVRI